jgi:hypothetical protein
MTRPIQDYGDSALPSLAEFVAEVSGAEAASDADLTVSELSVDLPIELRLSVDGGSVTSIAAGPPTQRTETSVMPVFHQLRLTLALDDGEGAP